MNQDSSQKKKTTKIGRHKQRTNAMKVIYQLSFNDNCQEVLSLYCQGQGIDLSTSDYMTDLVQEFFENKEDVDKILQECLYDNWSIKRLSKIDLAILRTTIVDIHYVNTPYKIAIDEAVELSKEYGQEESSSFVNGVLKTFIQKFTKENIDET